MAFFLLPRAKRSFAGWEKVARTKSASDEGLQQNTTPHPSALRAATLSHKGRGEGRRAARGHFASSFKPSRISIAVSAPSPAMREAPAIAAAACGAP
ncbi:MAG: hypothetical protein JWR89_444 [Tardiphaga sp.]|nr:hypothetical protein [Tardiphaga sp.]